MAIFVVPRPFTKLFAVVDTLPLTLHVSVVNQTRHPCREIYQKFSPFSLCYIPRLFICSLAAVSYHPKGFWPREKKEEKKKKKSKIILSSLYHGCEVMFPTFPTFILWRNPILVLFLCISLWRWKFAGLIAKKKSQLERLQLRWKWLIDLTNFFFTSCCYYYKRSIKFLYFYTFFEHLTIFPIIFLCFLLFSFPLIALFLYIYIFELIFQPNIPEYFYVCIQKGREKKL